MASPAANRAAWFALPNNQRAVLEVLERIGKLDQWQIGMDLNHLQRYQVYYAFGPNNRLLSEHQSKGESLEGENGIYQPDAATISDFASARDILSVRDRLPPWRLSGRTVWTCSTDAIDGRDRQG